MKQDRKVSWIFLTLTLLAVLVLFLFSPLASRPDRPVDTIAPGTSSGPAFVNQIMRPRGGLPLGGILPPQFFGLDAHLGFESSSAGASIDGVAHDRFEFSADDWEQVLVLDADGQVSPETEVVFEFVFEDSPRRVRCHPDDPAIGTIHITAPPEAGELSGSFDIELTRCEDADTGKTLGWPPQPLVLHGSFDRLHPDAGAKQWVRSRAIVWRRSANAGLFGQGDVSSARRSSLTLRSRRTSGSARENLLPLQLDDHLRRLARVHLDEPGRDREEAALADAVEVDLVEARRARLEERVGIHATHTTVVSDRAEALAQCMEEHVFVRQCGSVDAKLDA